MVLDADMNIKMANRALCEMFRLEEADITGKSIWRVAEGQWNTPRLRFLLESVQSSIREFKNFELEHVFPVIGRRTLLLNASRLQDGPGGQELILLAIQDTTDRKRIAEELRDSEERFRQLAENIDVFFWMIDLTTDRMIYASPGYELIFGRPRKELADDPRAWTASIHPEDQERVLKAISGKQRRARYEEEYRILRPDGAIRWIKDQAFPVKDESGNVYRVAGIAEDITEIKRVENLILEISGREQKRIGQDMHDGLCQSLTGLKFLSKVLAEKLAAKGLAQESADADEIGRVIGQALTQADVTAKGLFPVELEERGFLAGLKAMSAGVARVNGVTCVVDGDEAAAAILDPQTSMHLYRIAQEAVTNAVKHGQAKNIRIQMTSTQGKMSLTIHDDGSGIGKSSAKRAGMGMSIMRFRAHKIGGTLTIQRGDHGGTVVSCVFQNVERKIKFGRRRDDKIAL